jgi:hypothetical protein
VCELYLSCVLSARSSKGRYLQATSKLLFDVAHHNDGWGRGWGAEWRQAKQKRIEKMAVYDDGGDLHPTQ